MITVIIAINGTTIFARSAVNITKDNGNDLNEYKLDDGSIIKHRRSDGAKALAKKMIDNIEEV